MSPAEVLSLLGAAVDAGKAIAEIIPWAKQVRPELRTEPLPDAAGDMYAAREAALAREAAIHRAYGEALLAEAKQGNMRGGSIARIVERAHAAIADSPEAVEVYG